MNKPSKPGVIRRCKSRIKGVGVLVRMSLNVGVFLRICPNSISGCVMQERPHSLKLAVWDLPLHSSYGFHTLISAVFLQIRSPRLPAHDLLKTLALCGPLNGSGQRRDAEERSDRRIESFRVAAILLLALFSFSLISPRQPS